MALKNPPPLEPNLLDCDLGSGRADGDHLFRALEVVGLYVRTHSLHHALGDEEHAASMMLRGSSI